MDGFVGLRDSFLSNGAEWITILPVKANTSIFLIHKDFIVEGFSSEDFGSFSERSGGASGKCWTGNKRSKRTVKLQFLLYLLKA